LEAAGSNALPSITGYEPGVGLSEAAIKIDTRQTLWTYNTLQPDMTFRLSLLGRPKSFIPPLLGKCIKLVSLNGYDPSSSG
jgi:hypothetical protein